MTAVRTLTIIPLLGFCICIDGTFMGLSTPTTAFDGTIWYFADTMHFSLIRLLYMHRWCRHGLINSYYSFWWNNLILFRYNADTLNICMKEFGSQKIILTNWQLWELRQLFPYMAFVYAWIVPLWADQLLLQLLMKQFDTLPIQCRHIEHMHEGVYNFCLHRFYWNLIFKTKVCWFEL